MLVEDVCAYPKRTWIEIDSSILLENFKKMKKIYNAHQKVGVILKSNAYGHGLVECATILRQVCDMIYVMEPQEALLIREIERENGWEETNVAVLGNISQDEAIGLARKNIAFAIINDSFLKWDRKAFDDLVKPAQVHVFVDTGLGREGLRYDHVDIIKEINIFNNLKLCGIMTHFSNVEHDGPPEYARIQLTRFKSAITSIVKLVDVSPDSLIIHASASIPSLLYPEARFNMVRLGISLFGYWTSRESELLADFKYGNIGLEPVLTWKAEAINVKTIPKNDFVGYDCAYKCKRDTKIAVFQVGYYDGYPYFHDKIVHVIIEGTLCPIIGNVMMNCIVVDITDIEINENEKVIATLIGKDGNESITAEDLAILKGVSSYNIITAINPLVKRIVV